MKRITGGSDPSLFQKRFIVSDAKIGNSLAGGHRFSQLRRRDLASKRRQLREGAHTSLLQDLPTTFRPARCFLFPISR